MIETGRTMRWVFCLTLVFGLILLVHPPQVMADYGEQNLRWGSQGEAVRQLQQDLTALGYNTYGVDGIFGKNTYAAVLAFQKACGINVDGIVGTATKNALTRRAHTCVVKAGDTLSVLASRYGTTVSALMQANNLSSTTIYAGDALVIPFGREASRGSSRYGELADWWTVASKVFAVGNIATVTDVDTGLTYKVKRKGGTNHADCEPVTVADTAIMKKARGGYWSWNRRAVIVEVNGHRFAASQNGMPHGFQNIYDNNFSGHFCIHFLNSRTHATNSLDAAHQAMVLKAAGR